MVFFDSVEEYHLPANHEKQSISFCFSDLCHTRLFFSGKLLRGYLSLPDNESHRRKDHSDDFLFWFLVVGWGCMDGWDFFRRKG